MTLTLDVPPSTVATWNALPEDERRRRLPALIETIEAIDEDTDRREARAAIEEALAEVEAGKDMSYETFQQTRAAFWEARRAKAAQ